MKNLNFKTLVFVVLSTVAISCSSSDELITGNSLPSYSSISKKVSKTKNYKIRYGLLAKDGAKLLSGNFDVGSFMATDTVTGTVYDTSCGGGLSLPQYVEGILVGTYTFSEM